MTTTLEQKTFVEQTAKDYDMDYETVYEYWKSYDGLYFYEKLEEYIKDRANRNG